ncbi:MAG TPA: nickel pincer cofactor biosynthesis protein LarC [Longilinea sp.]|nr:nickel pincer cofactor biosynthesis protein LarC [Longilinea sp.]
MTILYCDCFSGISGDMFLGALLDAGLPIQHLDEKFQSLHLPEYNGVQIEKVKKGALAASLLVLDVQENAHSHDRKDEEHDQHEHHHHHETGSPRGLQAIADLIQSSDLSMPEKEISLKIFTKLAEAEAKVHGSSIEDVHFHEVGAVDSILDIVGAAIALEYFGITKVFSSALPLGSGQVMTQHGLLPLPAPATAELLRSVNAPVIPSPATCELVTPTGAAILAALAEFHQPAMSIHQIGLGAGRRDLDWPNILRIFIGEAIEVDTSHVEIETNIDDMNPQLYAPVMVSLFEAGALDVYFTPIYMKKNRPATKLSVIARKEDEALLSDIILRETTSLGVRVTEVHRHEAQRQMTRVQTPYGEVSVKIKLIDAKIVQASPEFEECVVRAKEKGVTPGDVLRAAQLSGQKLIEPSKVE